MTQEKVHGALKLRTDADQYDHTNVPEQSDRVNYQEYHKKEDLKLLTAGQAQKNKFHHVREIWHCLNIEPVCSTYREMKKKKTGMGLFYA